MSDLTDHNIDCFLISDLKGTDVNDDDDGDDDDDVNTMLGILAMQNKGVLLIIN